MKGLDWILHPLVQYVLLGTGLFLCLYLFFTLKLEIRAVETRLNAQATAQATVLTDAISAIRSAVDEIRAEIREVQEQTGMLVAPTPAKSGLNLNKRGQVLQMYRRGQSPEQIAATLGLPLTEIDLLIKVHQIVLDQVK
jgi:hypothetical protein